MIVVPTHRIHFCKSDLMFLLYRRLPSLARTTLLCKSMEPAVTATSSSFGDGSSRLAALAQQLRRYKPPSSSSFDDAEEMQTDQESAGKVVSQVGFQESIAPVSKDPERFKPKRAAVLICIFEGDDGDLRVILTKRSSRLSTHSGEVSLPGGKVEEDDKDDGMTAFSLPISSISSHFFPRHRGHANLRYRRFSVALSSTEEPSNRKNQTGVIIIGAGLAGLAAATRLTSERIPFLLVEASDGVGGRVRTDIIDGFFLDRGFQIFITAYPEAKKLLDYEALDLQRFYAGAKVYYGGKFHTVADPLRHLWDSVASLTNPIGSVVDKGLIALTRAKVLIKSDEEILTAADEVPTIDLLRKIGFSEAILDRFFRPFFGGIFFDRDLETTSKLFNFVFRCLALGENTLPAMGIGEIPNQLSAKLPANSVLLNTRVASIEYPNGSDSDPPSVRLEDGGVLEAELGVIIAVEQPQVDKLLDGIREPVMTKPARSTICVYFTAETNQIPVQDPVLFLNGSSTGIINNMFFATNVARTYAPPGKALVSVSLIGTFDDRSDDDLAAEIIRELSGWFNESSVMSWKHLKTYRIKFAQPNQCPPTDLVKSPGVGSGLYLCGDYMTSATFDGALVSGRRAVEVLLQERGLIKQNFSVI